MRAQGLQATLPRPVPASVPRPQARQSKLAAPPKPPAPPRPPAPAQMRGGPGGQGASARPAWSARALVSPKARNSRGGVGTHRNGPSRAPKSIPACVDLRRVGSTQHATVAAGCSRFDYPATFPPVGDKKALVHGFGAIGRGFLAEVFRRDGLQIVGVNRDSPLARQINDEGGYDIHIEAARGEQIEHVDAVRVVTVEDHEAVLQAYLEADVAALGLMPQVIPLAARDIASGLIARHDAGKGPLTLIVALNQLEGEKLVRETLRAELMQLAPDKADAVLSNLYIIETVVNRMARGPNDDERQADPTAVYTEPFYELPAQHKDGAPLLHAFSQVKPVKDLRPYEDMKLFLSNGAHAVTAYHGALRGHHQIADAIADPVIRREVEQMLSVEAGPAVAAKWGLPRSEVADYCYKVLDRFANPALHDTVARVGRSTVRKLGHDDRLVGPALLALEHGIEPKALARAIAAATCYDLADGDDEPAVVQSTLANSKGSGVRDVLLKLSHVDGPHAEKLIGLVEQAYTQMLGRAGSAPRADEGPQNVGRVFLKGVHEPVQLRQKLAEIGIDLDLRTGHIRYAGDFEPLHLPYGLTFVRHGQTFANVEPRRFQGQVDEANNQLNARGKQQAQRAAEQLRGLQRQGWTPDVTYASPFSRAQDTARAFTTDFEVLDGIKEMSFGHWDNQRVKDFAESDRCHLFYQQQNALVKGDGAGSESFAELLLRAHDTLTSLAEKHRGQQVLMFSHSMFGAACAILTGHGKQVQGAGHLGFDGDCLLPHATATRLSDTPSS